MNMARPKPNKPVKTMSVSMAADLFEQIEHLATERRRPKSWQMLEWVHAGMRSEGIQPADQPQDPIRTNAVADAAERDQARS